MKSSWRFYLKIAGCIFLLYLAIHYWPEAARLGGLLLGASFPLVLGTILAYVLNILMSFYERGFFPNSQNPRLMKARRPVCMLAAIISLLAIITLVIWLVLPQLWDCVELILAQLPGAIQSLIKQLDKIPFLSQDFITNLNSIDWQSKIGDIFNVVTSGVGNVMNVVINTLSSVVSAIINLFMACIFAIYLLMGRDKLKRQSQRVLQHYMRPHHYEKLLYVLGVVNNSFRRYIVGQCIEAVILGTLCAVGMSILRLPYASMIGALISFTALIPIAGAYIGAAVGSFMILTVSPMKALIFLIFLVILQQVEGNVIYPKVVGSSLGLPGIWVLTAVILGGGVLGIPGMLLGVPLAAAAYTLLRNDLNKEKKAPQT